MFVSLITLLEQHDFSHFCPHIGFNLYYRKRINAKTEVILLQLGIIEFISRSGRTQELRRCYLKKYKTKEPHK